MADLVKYRVKEDCKGYVNDRMETEGNVFQAAPGLEGSWFEPVEEVSDETNGNVSTPEDEPEVEEEPEVVTL